MGGKEKKLISYRQHGAPCFFWPNVLKSDFICDCSTKPESTIDMLTHLPLSSMRFAHTCLRPELEGGGGKGRWEISVGGNLVV